MSEFLSNYYLEFSYCSFTSLNVNIEKRAERERERERICFSSKNLEQIIIAMKGCDIWTVWRSLDASSSMVYAQQDMFMKKLVFNREKFSGSSIVIYASFSHASNLRCSVNIAENYSICFLMQNILDNLMDAFTEMNNSYLFKYF